MSHKRGIISTYASGVDLVVEWKIENVFNLPEKVFYCSPDFYFGGEKWTLFIFPNGWRISDSSGHVDLVLCKHDSDHSIKQSFSLSLKTAKGEKYNEQHGTKDFDNDYWFNGFHRFIPRSELGRRRSDLAPDGNLTVICTMKSSTSAGSDCNSASSSDKCRHCKGTFNADSLSSHQKKCMHRPLKCPDCLEVVVLQTWFDEHECQQERPEAGKEHKENSENTGVNASTQTEEKDIDEWFKEKPRNAYVEASTQTKEQREELKGMATAELNKADGLDEAEASCFNQTGAVKTKRSLSPINLTEERDWVTNVSEFLKEGRGVDVTFELETPSGKTRIFAHQLILALRSPYFADEFYSKRRNKGHLIISLKGIDPKAFEILIRYCYDYKPCLRTTKDACALFKVAFEFKVISLQNLCHTFFRHTKIEPENIFTILKVSVEMEDKSLGDMCYQILEDKTSEVMAVFDLCKITPAMVYTLLKLPTLSLNSEYELIKWLFDWGDVKSKDKDSSSKNAREYLGRLLKDMNFLALTMGEFAVLCKDNPEFFSSDEIISIYQNIACPGTKEMPTWYNSNVKCRVYTGSKE